MSTIVFAALLPIRLPAGTASPLAAALHRSVRAQLSSRFERKNLGVLIPEEPRDWNTAKLQDAARAVLARFIVGVDVLELRKQDASVGHAPGAQFILSAKVRAHVWDAQTNAMTIDGATAEASEQIGVPGPNPTFVESGFVRLVAQAAANAMAPLIGSE